MERDKSTDLELSLKNRIAREDKLDRFNKFKKNTLKFEENLKIEKELDNEIYTLKNELSKLDETINDTKRSFLEEKSFTGDKGNHLIANKKLKEMVKRKDIEIERYKIAYEELLKKWEDGLSQSGADTTILSNYRHETQPQMDYGEIYSNRFKKNSFYDPVEPPELDVSYADKYRKKMGLEGNDRSKSPMRNMGRILPQDITGYPIISEKGGNFGRSDRVIRSPLIKGNYPEVLPSGVRTPLLNQFQGNVTQQKPNIRHIGRNNFNYNNNNNIPGTYDINRTVRRSTSPLNYQSDVRNKRELSPNQRNIPRALVYTGSPERNSNNNFVQKQAQNRGNLWDEKPEIGRNIGVGGYDLDRRLSELKNRRF